MYNLLSAIVLSKSTEAQYVISDISTQAVCDIYNNYNKVFLTLSNTFISGNVYVDLDTLRNEFGGYPGTIQALLTSLGNRSLTTITSLPNTSVKYASYADASMTGYKTNLTLIGSPNTNTLLQSQLKDAILTRPNTTTDLSLLHTHCLVSVNGYFHRTDTDNVNAFIYDAGASLQKSNTNHIGILSFLDIGTVTKQSINITDIGSQGLTSTLYERTYINTNQDISNKTVLLVVGGYLVFPDANTFWITGPNTVAINWSNMPLLERYFDSLNYLDLSSLGLDISTVNPDTINIAQFFSDSVLQKYLMLSQSFLVIIDTPNLFTNTLPLANTGFPCMYTSYQQPTSLLVGPYGKVLEYVSVFEDTQWSISVADSLLRNYVLTNTPLSFQTNVANRLVPVYEYSNSNVALLQIGSYK